MKNKLLEITAGLCLLIAVACDAGSSKNEEAATADATTEKEEKKEGKKKKDKNPATEGFAVNNTYDLLEMSKMGKKSVPESSGLETSSDGNYWTHPDAGNEAVLYKINQSGELLETMNVQGAKNNDWEDVARGSDGFLYIGDMGNNENTRQDLQILKVDEKAKKVVGTIPFKYADQTEFPPSKQNLNFDVEGFLMHNNAFYLFTKNRGKSDWVKLYKVANQTGASQTVQPLDSLQITTKITAADISPNGRHIALLGEGWVYLFEADTPEGVFKGKKEQIPLGKVGQAEGLVFVNDTDMMISNEAGRLFMLSLKK
ncbi:hypothetical protein ACD591_16005 [Rufibacter glacialis]|uniref:Uncharacterized protein n=1 Tax=Rufibacter glacialis TaxID=1259555 RepID=A0A5M8QQN5_9BACT|nr:hypothetical protein [Rufibacter glacialis]KAA6437551.1 hypothetical protein FOE74_03335 [Rufibacter glacialis]GGK58392.1 hypothetical protein GCM10011405_03090 [Rufibacter glacialis]